MMGQLCILRLLLVNLFVLAGTIAKLLQPCKEILQNECVLESPIRNVQEMLTASLQHPSRTSLLLNASQVCMLCISNDSICSNAWERMGMFCYLI